VGAARTMHSSTDKEPEERKRRRHAFTYNFFWKHRGLFPSFFSTREKEARKDDAMAMVEQAKSSHSESGRRGRRGRKMLCLYGRALNFLTCAVLVLSYQSL